MSWIFEQLPTINNFIWFIAGIFTYIIYKKILKKPANTSIDSENSKDKYKNKNKQYNELSKVDLSEKELKGFETHATILVINFKDFIQASNKQNSKDKLLMLNLFSSAVRNSILSHGGTVKLDNGLSLVAIFGIKQQSPVGGCINAIKAIKKIDYSIKRINGKYRKKFYGALKASIALHSGNVLIGQIGQYENTSLTFLGQAIDTTIKLEELIQEKDTQIVMSNDAAAIANLSANELNTEYVLLRDENIPIEVVYFKTASEMPKSKNLKNRSA